MMASEIARRQSGGPARQSRGQSTAYATYTVTDAPQTPARPQARARQPRSYSGPSAAPRPSGGNSIGVLEAEYFATIILIALTVFTDQTSSYASKMLAVMKRLTFASILFFVLALLSTGSENSAKFSKAIGALVLAGVFLGTAGQGTISAMDSFFKADWTQGSTTEGDSSANAAAGSGNANSTTASSKLQTAEQAALNALSRVGNGVTGTASNNPYVQALQRLLGAI